MSTWDEDQDGTETDAGEDAQDGGADASDADDAGESDDAEASDDADAENADDAEDDSQSEGSDSDADQSGDTEASEGSDAEDSSDADEHDTEASDADDTEASDDDAEAGEHREDASEDAASSDDDESTDSNADAADDTEASDDREPEHASDPDDSSDDTATDDTEDASDDDERSAGHKPGKPAKKPKPGSAGGEASLKLDQHGLHARASDHALAGAAGKATRTLRRKHIDPDTGEVVESEVEVAAEGEAGAVAGGESSLAADLDGVHGEANGDALAGVHGKVKVRAKQRRYDPETGIGSEHSADLEVEGTAGVWADGSASVDLDAHGVHAKIAAGAEVDLDADQADALALDGVTLHSHQHAHLDAFAGAKASGKAELHAGPDGVAAIARGEAFAGVQATASVKQDAALALTGMPEVGAFHKNSVHGQAGAGARGQVVLGPTGGSVTASAFAGAKGTLKSESGLTVEGLDIFSVEGKVSGLAGAGGEIDLDAGADADGNLSIGGDVDAALGLGAGAGVKLKINPTNALKATDIVAHKTLDSLAKLPTDPQGALEDMKHNTEQVLGAFTKLFQVK